MCMAGLTNGGLAGKLSGGNGGALGALFDKQRAKNSPAGQLQDATAGTLGALGIGGEPRPFNQDTPGNRSGIQISKQ